MTAFSCFYISALRPEGEGFATVGVLCVFGRRILNGQGGMFAVIPGLYRFQNFTNFFRVRIH